MFSSNVRLGKIVCFGFIERERQTADKEKNCHSQDDSSGPSQHMGTKSSPRPLLEGTRPPEPSLHDLPVGTGSEMTLNASIPVKDVAIPNLLSQHLPWKAGILGLLIDIYLL